MLRHGFGAKCTLGGEITFRRLSLLLRLIELLDVLFPPLFPISSVLDEVLARGADFRMKRVLI